MCLADYELKSIKLEILLDKKYQYRSCLFRLEIIYNLFKKSFRLDLFMQSYGRLKFEFLFSKKETSE